MSAMPISLLFVQQGAALTFTHHVGGFKALRTNKNKKKSEILLISFALCPCTEVINYSVKQHRESCNCFWMSITWPYRTSITRLLFSPTVSCQLNLMTSIVSVYITPTTYCKLPRKSTVTLSWQFLEQYFQRDLIFHLLSTKFCQSKV